MIEDCIFCKIIKGEIPSEIVLDSKDFISIKNIHPKSPIHILIMPKAHIEKVDAISGNIKNFWSEIMLFTNGVILKLGLDKTGYRIINNGAGYQGVNHEHIHIMGGKDWKPKDGL